MANRQWIANICRLIAIVVLSALCITAGVAQQQSSIIGRIFIVDADGSLSYILAAEPKLQCESDIRASISDPTGRFSFDLLPPGAYLLSAGVAGMKSNQQSIDLRVGGAADVEIRMEPAGVNEEISNLAK